MFELKYHPARDYAIGMIPAKKFAETLSQIKEGKGEFEISDFEPILEVGCGYGHSVRFGEKFGLDIWGTDIRDKFIADKNRFTQADITDKLPYDDDSFGMIYESLFLHDMIKLQSKASNMTKVMGEIKRVLKPEGYLFIKGTNTYRQLLEDNGFKQFYTDRIDTHVYFLAEQYYIKNDS